MAYGWTITVAVIMQNALFSAFSRACRDLFEQRIAKHVSPRESHPPGIPNEGQIGVIFRFYRPLRMSDSSTGNYPVYVAPIAVKR